VVDQTVEVAGSFVERRLRRIEGEVGVASSTCAKRRCANERQHVDGRVGTGHDLKRQLCVLASADDRVTPQLVAASIGLPTSPRT